MGKNKAIARSVFDKTSDFITVSTVCTGDYFAKYTVFGDKLITTIRILKPWKEMSFLMVPRNVGKRFKYQELSYTTLNAVPNDNPAQVSFNQIIQDGVPQVMGMSGTEPGVHSVFEDIEYNEGIIVSSAYNTNGVILPDICENTIMGDYEPLAIIDKQVIREIKLEGYIFGNKKDCYC